jgi:hypothetical protein
MREGAPLPSGTEACGALDAGWETSPMTNAKAKTTAGKWLLSAVGLVALAGVLGWRAQTAVGATGNLQRVPITVHAPAGVQLHGFEVRSDTVETKGAAQIGALLLGGQVEVDVHGYVANRSGQTFDGGTLTVEFLDANGEVVLEDCLEMLQVPPGMQWDVGTGKLPVTTDEAQATRRIRLRLDGRMVVDSRDRGLILAYRSPGR